MTDVIFYTMVSLFAIAPGAQYEISPDEVGPLIFNRPRAEVSQLYKDGTRFVSNPILDTRQADEKCPNGWSVRNQETRTTGGRDFLVWTLICK